MKKFRKIPSCRYNFVVDLGGWFDPMCPSAGQNAFDESGMGPLGAIWYFEARKSAGITSCRVMWEDEK